jgi:hypothetical protein
MVDAVGTSRYTYTDFGALLSEDGPWDSDTVSYGYIHPVRYDIIQSIAGSMSERHVVLEDSSAPYLTGQANRLRSKLTLLQPNASDWDVSYGFTP